MSRGTYVCKTCGQSVTIPDDGPAQHNCPGPPKPKPPPKGK